MKISLASQIAEIDRELTARADVYPRLIKTNRMRQSIADIQVKHLEQARETLTWLKENERMIKQRLAP